MVIIRFILFLLFFYLAWFIIRNLFVKPFKQGYAERRTKGGRSNSSGPEGSVTLNKNGAGRTHDDGSMGEYIDYEEVQEDDKE